MFYELVLGYESENPCTWRPLRGHPCQPLHPQNPPPLAAHTCPPGGQKGSFCTDTWCCRPPTEPSGSFLKDILRAWSSCPLMPEVITSIEDLVPHALSWLSHGTDGSEYRVLSNLCRWVCSQPEKGLIGQNALICGTHEYSHSCLHPEQNSVCRIDNMEDSAFRKCKWPWQPALSSVPGSPAQLWFSGPCEHFFFFFFAFENGTFTTWTFMVHCVHL